MKDIKRERERRGRWDESESERKREEKVKEIIDKKGRRRNRERVIEREKEIG